MAKPNNLSHQERKALFDSYVGVAVMLAKRYDNRHYSNPEDIRQEAFLALWKACVMYDADKANGDDGFQKYAYRAILNAMKCIYLYRKHWAKEFTQVSNDNASSLIIEFAESRLPHAGKVIEVDEECQRFLRSLPEAYREAAVLHFFHEIPYKEIQKRLDFGCGLSASINQRASQYRHQKYSEEYE